MCRCIADIQTVRAPRLPSPDSFCRPTRVWGAVSIARSIVGQTARHGFKSKSKSIFLFCCFSSDSLPLELEFLIPWPTLIYSFPFRGIFWGILVCGVKMPANIFLSLSSIKDGLKFFDLARQQILKAKKKRKKANNVRSVRSKNVMLFYQIQFFPTCIHIFL